MVRRLLLPLGAALVIGLVVSLIGLAAMLGLAVWGWLAATT